MSCPAMLPRGWSSSALGEALPIEYGKGLPERKRQPGEVRVYGSSGPVGTHNVALTEGAAVVIGRKGNVGAVHYSPEPCWPIDTVYFAEGSPNTNLQFFSYVLESLQLARLDKSTAIPGLSRDDYNVLEVLVPPLPEQSRIVDAIETQLTRLDAAVAALERVQANLKRYRASVLKAAVEGQLVPTEAQLARQEGRDYESAAVLLKRILAERRRRWEEAELADLKAKSKTPKDDKWKAKYEEPVAPDTTGLPDLPEGWCWVTLGVVAPLQPGYAFPSNGFVKAGVRLLKGSNVRDGWVAEDGIDHWPADDRARFEHFRLSAGDIVLAMDRPVYSSGTRATKVVMLGTAWEGALLLQRVGCFRRVDSIDPHYLYRFLASDYFRQHLVGRQIGTQDGKDLPHVSARAVDSCPFPLPPLAEQRTLALHLERLLSISEFTATNAGRNLSLCHRLRQAILKWACEGRLVDQNPNDESASVLLERIRAERAVATVKQQANTKRAGRKRKAA